MKTKKGGGQDKQIKLNKIKSKEVWSRYEDECKNNKLLRKFLTKYDNKKDNGKDGEEVEELWSEFKELVKIMENWVRNTAKEVGSRQYEFIDKDIENSRCNSHWFEIYGVYS